MKQRYGIYVGALIAAVLTGCGGGGSSAPSNQTSIKPPPPVAVVVPEPIKPIAVQGTSYANAKMNGAGAVTLPASYHGTAFTRADFFQDGTLGLFTAALQYDPKNPIDQAKPGVMTFWKKTGSTWTADATKIVGAQTGCIHPRKALVADFNKDGKPDVLVACHGYDAAPFPGEAMVMLLSTADGKYTYKELTEFKGYNHSATAADFNNDGYADILVADIHSKDGVRMLINKGDGAFTEANYKLPQAVNGRRYYTVEATDTNNDGKLDILLGGHEWEADTRVLILQGNGTENFQVANAVTLPGVAGHGVVLDFLVTNKGLIVNRTSGGNGSYYTSKVVQLIDLVDGKSTVLVTDNGGDWTPWLIATANGVTSEDPRHPVSATL